MKRIVQYRNLKIAYTLEIKQVKNINLHIDPTGEIYVSANEFVPVEKIDRFVLEKLDWIIKKQTQMIRRPVEKNDQVFSYLGKKYSIEYHLSNSYSVKLEENSQERKCHVYAKDASEIEAVLEKFIRQQCERLFPVYMNKAYEMMSLDYSLKPVKLKIRKMDTRWGSCIPQKNQITLNTRLIHYDSKFLEYVVWHEFAHLIQPNHSKAFYHVIEKYMPDYKQASKLYKKLPEEESI